MTVFFVVHARLEINGTWAQRDSALVAFGAYKAAYVLCECLFPR